MAKVHVNSMISRISGEVDGFVYKTIRGRVFLTKKPVFRRRKWSVAQREGHDRLKAASAYAKAVWADPAQKAFYEQLGRKRKAWRAYSLATADFLNPPEIRGITCARDGEQGAVVWIDAIDDVEVVTVEVIVRDEKRVVTRGAATLVRDRWCFTVPQGPLAGLEVEAIASDRPGNRTRSRQRVGR